MAYPRRFARRDPFPVGIALALMLVSARRVEAQSETGRLEGDVASKNAAVAPTGAVVEATRLDSDSVSTDRAPVDDRGRYRFDALRPGDYAVRLTAPLLDSLALSLPERPATIVAGTVVRVDLALPSGQAIRDAVCPGVSLGRGRGVVAGHATDADTEEPLVGARVVVQWRELAVDDSTLRVASAERAGETFVGRGGEYRLCGVPTDTRLEVQLQHGARASADVVLTVPDSVGAVAMDLSLSAAGALDSVGVAAPADAQRTIPEKSGAARRATVRGIVRGTLGQPLANTEVRARDVEARVVTDSSGRFSLSSLPAGTQVLLLRHIGYEPVEVPVELRADRITSRDIRLTRAISLDSVRVVALRSQYPEFDYNRRSNPFGRYLTPDEVERRKPTEPTDLLFGIPGLTVVGHGPTAAVVSTRHLGCTGVNVIVDGVEHVEPNIVSANDVAAVEIYSDGTFAPSRFAIRGSCGVVVIWTKASRRSARPAKPAGEH